MKKSEKRKGKKVKLVEPFNLMCSGKFRIYITHVFKICNS